MNPGHLCFLLDKFQDAIKESCIYSLVDLSTTVPWLTIPRHSGWGLICLFCLLIRWTPSARVGVTMTAALLRMVFFLVYWGRTTKHPSSNLNYRSLFLVNPETEMSQTKGLGRWVRSGPLLLTLKLTSSCCGLSYPLFISGCTENSDVFASCKDT